MYKAKIYIVHFLLPMLETNRYWLSFGLFVSQVLSFTPPNTFNVLR